MFDETSPIFKSLPISRGESGPSVQPGGQATKKLDTIAALQKSLRAQGLRESLHQTQRTTSIKSRRQININFSPHLRVQVPSPHSNDSPITSSWITPYWRTHVCGKKTVAEGEIFPGTVVRGKRKLSTEDEHLVHRELSTHVVGS